MWLLFLACTDYNLNKNTEVEDEGILDSAEPDDADPILAPQLEVNPTDVSEISICNARDVDIVLTNTGDGELQITGIELSGEGWAMESPELPIFLAPAENTTIIVNGWDGTASLQIDSNDPITPQQVVSLYAEADQPPVVSITDPYPHAILPVGGMLLTGLVDDVEDDPQDLMIEWRSDIDGLLGDTPATADGVVSAEFYERSSGSHEITLTVRDSCENEESVSLPICQQFGYEVETLDISTWHFEGSAFWDTVNDWVELTSPTNNVVGSAFSTAFPVDAGNVQIDFLFYIGDGSGADGISLTALDVDRMTGFLGGTGCGIGYGGDAGCTAGPALPGWSIEVDTWFNGGVDPTEEDHLAFSFDGDVDDYQSWATLPEMEDTGWHHMRVEVVAPHVYVEIDGVAYIDADLMGGAFNFPAYIGFTAGTGGSTNAHKISSLMVTETSCPEIID